MARLLGIDIPNEKRIDVSLTRIHGIGWYTARKVLAAVGIEASIRTRDLSEEELKRIAIEVEGQYTVEGALRRQVQTNIQRLKDIGCYRGLRHRRGLPARGQRTKTNARTRKGKKRTVAVKRSIKAMR
jgi:small subunit ribosomal protein S13